MLQEIITYLIIATAVFYVMLKLSKLIVRKKASPCDNCSGCAIKDIKSKEIRHI